MTPTRMLPRALLALALLAPATAHADPPEGCIGFPDIPEAFVCVTQWTPENAVPTVTPGPDQTVVIPEFCVFQCFGPTPVTIPSFVVNPGNGAIAVIQYDGQTYTVAVPPVPDPNALIQQVVSTVTGLVQQVLDAVDDARPPNTFTANVYYSCYGCGSTNGNLAGTFTGVINGHQYQNASMSAYFNANADPASCALSSTAAGNITIGSDSASFSWTHFADTVSIVFSGGFTGTGQAVFLVLGPSGVACGSSATFPMTGTITTT